MDFAFNDTQREIKDGAHRLLADPAFAGDPGAYAQLAELGWTGLHIPEAHGGVGLSYVELVVVLEEMGAALVASPFFASVCLAANALLESSATAELSESNAELLAAIAAGEQTATLAYAEPGGRFDPEDVKLRARADGSDYVLSGEKVYVLDGHTADTLIVVARTGDAPEELLLLTVPSDATGVTCSESHSVDPTRPHAAVSFADVRVPAAAVLGDPASSANLLESTVQLASVALAAESLGAAQHCFDTTLSYVKDRHQFGRPIASFQAVKHICADLLMAVEGARSAAYYAGWTAAERREELPQVAPLAKAQASEAFWDVARANIQLHGGIGFTYEHEAHYYYRRATVNRALLGSTSEQRERMLLALGA